MQTLSEPIFFLALRPLVGGGETSRMPEPQLRGGNVCSIFPIDQCFQVVTGQRRTTAPTSTVVMISEMSNSEHVMGAVHWHPKGQEFSFLWSTLINVSRSCSYNFIDQPVCHMIRPPLGLQRCLLKVLAQSSQWLIIHCTPSMGIRLSPHG